MSAPTEPVSRALAAFRDHARRMAESTPDTRLLLDVGYGRARRMKVGNLSEAERALWRQLAGEADGFLRGTPEDEDARRVPTEDDVALPL